MLHGLDQFFLGKVIVTFKSDPADLNPRTAVYVESYPDGVLDYRILLLKHLDLALEEAFLMEIFLYDIGGRFYDVVREFGSPLEFQPFVKVGFLAAADSVEQPAGNPWALCKAKTQPHGIPGS